jgi:hypothetical protein
MTNSALNGYQHELFPAFFLAGIIFYRQWRQVDASLAEKARASLDNCLILLNQAADFWDPGTWVVKMFELLASSSDDTGGNSNMVSVQEIDGPDNLQPTTSGGISESFNSPLADLQQAMYPPINTGTIFDANIPTELRDFMVMPNFFPPLKTRRCSHYDDVTLPRGPYSVTP